MFQSASDAKSEELPGQETFKLYSFLFEQVSSEHKSLLSSYLKVCQPLEVNTSVIEFQATYQQQLPIFSGNIHNILNPTSYISRQVFQKMLEEISSAIKKEISNYQYTLDSLEQQQYARIAVLSEKMWRQNKKFKIFQNVQWTKQKMMELDMLSIFLKISQRYKRLNKMNSLVYSPRYICEIFNWSPAQLDSLIERLEQFSYLIVPHNSFEIEQIAMILYVVELRIKMANFYRRYGKNRAQASLKMKESTPLNIQNEFQMDQFAYFTFHEQYTYRFCEIAFIPNGKQSNTRLQQIKLSHQAQLKEALRRLIKEGKTQYFFQIRQQLLFLKIKFSVSFLGLFLCYQEAISNQQKDSKPQGKHFSLDIELCPWVFIKDQGLEAVGKEIFNIELNYFHVSKDSPLFISLCEMAINRFRLYSTVVQAHSIIDSYLKRQMVYICKFDLKASDFLNLEKEQAEDIMITLIITVVKSDIRYAILAPGKIEDIQFARIIKSHFQAVRRSKTSIIIYGFDYKDDFHPTAIKSLFTIRKQADLRVYFTNSPFCFHLHFMAYFLVRALLYFRLKKAGQFVSAVKEVTSKIFKAINVAHNIRDLFRGPDADEEKLDCRTYNPQFDEKHTRLIISKAYQGLTQVIFQRIDNGQIWGGSNPTNQRCIHLFSRDQFNKKVEEQSDKSKAKQLNQWMKKKQVNFVAEFVAEMRWRHPYVTSKQYATIRSNLTLFRMEKHMQLRDIRRILMYVCRCLLCYQAYFNQMMHRNELDQAGSNRFRRTLIFLQQNYAEQSKYIDQLYPQQKDRIAQQLFGIELLTGGKMRYKDYSVWNRQLNPKDTKKKAEPKAHNQRQNCKGLPNTFKKQ